MLDDLLMADSGLVGYGADSPTHALMGRFGNVLLVNGEPQWNARVNRGDVVRLFLTNVSSTRVFNVSFAGAARMKVVASDLSRFERETWIENVTIADHHCPDTEPDGAAVVVEGGSAITVRNANFWGNSRDFATLSGGTVSVSYSITAQAGSGNFNSNPLFADAAIISGQGAGALDPASVANPIKSSVGASIIWDSPFGPLRGDMAWILSQSATDSTTKVCAAVACPAFALTLQTLL